MKLRHRLGIASKIALAIFALAAILLGCNNPLVEVAKSLRAEAGSPILSLTKGSATLKPGDSVDFGPVSTNGYRDISLTIGNFAGNSALSVDLSKVEYSLGETTEESTFSVVTAQLDPINSGGSATFVIRFSPISIGSKSAVISVPTNDVKIPLLRLTLTGTSLANEKNITSFEISSPVSAIGVINDTAIAIDVPHGTDLTKLVASFTTTGLAVSVGGNPQVSGTTVRDFTNPVVYGVAAADGTIKNFTVTVTVAKDDAKAITEFTFPAFGVTATFSGFNIAATLPYGTPLDGLVPFFRTTGTLVTVGEKTQLPGITPNDFTSALTYRVSAEDGTYRDYTVTAKTALDPAKEITAFSLAIPNTASYASGIINGTSISVTVPYGTPLNALVASFLTTGASVRVGGANQASGVTPNNFTNSVAYTVVAADGTTKDFSVRVTVASNTAKDIISFTAFSPASAAGMIDGTTIRLYIPYSNAYSTFPITVAYTTTGASVYTLGAQQFGSSLVVSSGQTYTVYAGDGSTKIYTVIAEAKNVVPSLATGSVGSVGQNSAQVGGSIVHSGGVSLPIIDSGICWSTSPSPTIANSHLSNGSAGAGPSSISALTMTGLSPGTKYFVSAYATNSVGTGYGAPSSFWTLLGTPSAPTVSALGGPSGSGMVSLSWAPVEGATAYDVYYSGLSSPPSAPNGPSTASTSCTISGLTNFSSYNFWIVARSASPTPSAMSPAGSGGPGVHVASISIPTAKSLLAGTTDQLTPTIAPNNATNPTITWASSDPTVASVSASGLVTAGATVGTATITATAQSPDASVQASCAITVLVPVTGVSLDKTSASLLLGATTQLAATVAPADASNKTLTWSSSDEAVATVDASGLVTAEGPGTAIITARTVDGGKTATCNVTVSIAVTGVSLNKTISDLRLPGGSEQLVATVAPANATNKSVTWSSSNESVATVSASGLVTAAGVGTATITVQTADSGKTATCDVSVTIAVTDVSLNKVTSDLRLPGGSEQLVATVAPTNATNQSVTWSSSNPAIATVSASGLVAAAGVGSAIITVTTADMGKTATCNVTVSIAVTGLSLNKSASNLRLPGGSEQLVATVAPANATNQNVTWSSSNTSAVTVDQSGNIAALAVGSAIITATTVDMGKTATCFVEVTTITHVYAGAGVYTLNVPVAATVTVKAWGAGGGGGKSSDSGGGAGAGAYAYSVFSASAGQSLAIAVGAGGWNTAPSGAPALGGVTGGYGGPGGGASVVALYNGSLYTLEACAAGGGGATGHNSPISGAGGQAGSYGAGAGANGVGGAGGSGNSGVNMSLTAATFAGLGGSGGAAKISMSGAGGGGYGGGGANGYSTLYYDAAGGGNYGNGGSVTAGDRATVANTVDADYLAGVGKAGTFASPTGGDGRVVITISVKTVYSAAAVSSLAVTAPAWVAVKAWGAGGGGGKQSNSGGGGGAGGFASAFFRASAGQSLSIAVGAGGWNTAPSGAPALGGVTGGYGGPGGGASVVALYNGSLYTLEACAAGGGGATGHNSAISGAGGQAGSYGAGAGANGVGGAGGSGNSGVNMSLTAATFAGLGGSGGAAKISMSGAGGGGYGGGGANGYSALYYDAAGGGNYGNGGSVIGGDRETIANTADADYVTGVGKAGTFTAQAGGNGGVVVTLYY